MYLVERYGKYLQGVKREFMKYDKTPPTRLIFERDSVNAQMFDEVEIADWGLVPGMHLRKVITVNDKKRVRTLSDLEHAQLQLKYLRRKRQYSVAQIREICGVSGESLQKFLLDSTQLKDSTRYKIIANLKEYKELKNWNYD